MFDKEVAIHPIYFEDLDAVFDEKGSSFLTMRKTQWVKDGEEGDASKAKLELRKYIVTSDGERAGKGVSFLTESGPGELAKTLIQHGYGNTKELLLELKKRDDFAESVKTLFTDDKENNNIDGEYFDMRTELLKDSPDENEDDAVNE